MKVTIDVLNKMIRETLDHYYQFHDAESFFKIDSILSLCRKHDLGVEQVPALIEMQNVIVIG